MLFAAGLACAGAAIVSQADEVKPPSDAVTIKSLRNTMARVAPDSSAATAFELPANTELTWIAQQQSNGFYRTIRINRGPQGWVAASDIVVVRREPIPSAPTKACVADMATCPLQGCALQSPAEGIANELKRTQPTGPLSQTLTFGDFAQLQRVADIRVGQGPPDLSAQQRAQLGHIEVGGGEASEGDRIRLLAYIAKSETGLHVNASGESVNCLLKNPRDNDFHIPVVEHAGENESQAIVVEMIPQDRPPEWNIDALKKIQAQGAQVWIEGALSYDKVHYVETDPANALKDEPARMSLWEIHPVTKFLVCRKDHCDPDRESDWSMLGQGS
jgi:hypothetical protein